MVTVLLQADDAGKDTPLLDIRQKNTYVPGDDGACEVSAKVTVLPGYMCPAGIEVNFPSQPRSWYWGDFHTVVPVFLNRTNTLMEEPATGRVGVMVKLLTMHCALSLCVPGVGVTLPGGDVLGGRVDPGGSRVGVAREYA